MLEQPATGKAYRNLAIVVELDVVEDEAVERRVVAVRPEDVVLMSAFVAGGGDPTSVLEHPHKISAAIIPMRAR